MINYNPKDWYWIVKSNGNIWSSKYGYVLENNEKYIAFLASGCFASHVDTELELSNVLVQFNVAGPVFIVPDQIPLWQGRTILKKYNYFEAVNAYIDAHKEIDYTMWESFNMGNYFARSTLLALAPVFGFTTEQTDALMIEASTIIV